MATKSKNQPTNQPLTQDEINNLNATLINSLIVSGTPSEVIESLGYLPAEVDKRKSPAIKELACKDAHFSNFTFLFGELPVFSYTMIDGAQVSLNAVQLVYLLKNTQADYKDTLKNSYLIGGGIDYSYEPIGATLTAQSADNSALRVEFAALLATFSTDNFKADIVKNGRKPDQYRLSVSHDVLSTLWPEKLRFNVMQTLFSFGMEFLEFIRDDDDRIISIVIKTVKD